MTDNKYNPQKIEPRWQQYWEDNQTYRSEVDWDRPKHYAVTMLPYPSGDLHIGHWYAMTPSDARARYMRMKGYNVLFPMGFDAFGLPAEQAAINRNIHPWKWTYSNIERMRQQLRTMGTMFDWEREAISSTPQYYQWTEWFFLKLYEHGLAYRKDALVNWSDALQTVLANEQVIDGKDERLGQPVIQKMMTQWFFKITDYADELLNFETLDWPEPIKIMQTNWIGRSEGARVTFKTETGDEIVVFTTRPDTLWGATFMVLAPEHPLVDKLVSDEQRQAVEMYRKETAAATEIERLSEDRDKTGLFIGAYAINPVTNQKMPIWIADYVMISYGTGAIMGVPYGDQRDFDFARKFDLDIIPVVIPEGEDEAPRAEDMTEAYAGSGRMVNSGPINGSYHNGEKGRKSEAIAKAIDYLTENGIGQESINYRLRDWLISRQRYWGAPIPMIHQQDGGIVPVPYDQLPVELPEDVEFMPTGRSPLTYHEPFLNTVDPEGKAAKRETDTMDTFMCSSWYQYRYLSPNFSAGPFDPEEAAYWLPVDVYTGGAEHATMHLLYTRFFTKAMRDMGVFDETQKIMEAHGRDSDDLFDEPMLLLRNQGQVLGSERNGDYILASGKWDGEAFLATQIKTVPYSEIPESFDGVAGELMKRVENNLFVGPDLALVIADEKTKIDLHAIEGKNNLNQLKHHLEIQRMSKSKGNVVNPDELVSVYGADTVRAYLMFAFDWEKGGPWDPKGVTGVVRWLNDMWDLMALGDPQGDGSADRDIEHALHVAIDQVSRGLEKFSFNTSIAGLMALRNEFRTVVRGKTISSAMWKEVASNTLRLMAPFTPYIAEEMWHNLGYETSIHTAEWPIFDPEKAIADEVELVVMINGKPREKIMVPAGIDQASAEGLALESAAVIRALDGQSPRKVIFIPASKGQDPKVNIVASK